MGIIKIFFENCLYKWVGQEMFNFKQFHVFFTSFSSILNRKYLLLHCCCFSGGTFVSETFDWNAKTSPSLAILRGNHAQVLWALAQLPPTQVIILHLNCFELVHIDGGLVREQMRMMVMMVTVMMVMMVMMTMMTMMVVWSGSS